MSDVSTALANVEEFRTQSDQSVSWGLNRNDVIQRLKALLQAPNLLDQRGLNACAPAAFFRVWLARDPVAAAAFTCQMLRHGSSTIGSLTVDPDADLTGQDYSTLRADTNAQHPNAMPESTDWMLLSALRDSENIYFDYLGQPYTLGDSVAGLTLPGTLAGWLSATHLYSSVSDNTTLLGPADLPPLLDLIPTSNVDILLFVNANAIYDLATTPGPPEVPFPVFAVPDHYVLMAGPFVQADGTNWIDIDVWTWGSIKTGWQKIPRFLNNSFGWMVATV
ncbi:hypothetical protein NFX46_19395 [Streptomyces phaeoluteigriseus]|uniref:Uncharacterized protein n=1 Tax=Streptomyces phaeoluteigriseus TaxID=114686 RepID=A0ABY4Z9L4_9ACTN|nr:hypothetical protein [Streptomyces phaeoluteigriseus]USQ85734.1 hypothetical protein NFX46_19395 [Streptomyces phaeoluteigriseus]